MTHMAEITFNVAQKALGHLRNKNQGEKPPLLSVKGWDKSKKIYHLKDDLERAFKTEIDRFQDLIQERQKLQREAQQGGETKDLVKQFEAISEEIQELFDVEKDVELTGGKLSEKEFGDVIDAEIYIDLEFAIQNGTPPKNEDDG